MYKMVRKINKAVLPMSGGTIRTSTRQHIQGRGVGAVLLDGGLGGQSSYASLDDYIHTTHQNPFKKEPQTIKGLGIEAMNKKIENLLVKSRKHNPKKDKNINFNL